MMSNLSKNDRAQKEQELKWFEACQALCSFFPRGKPEQNPSHGPEPDILYREIKLGVEITEYLPKQTGGSPLRASEAQHARILESAKKAFEQFSHQQVFVSVSWDPHLEHSTARNDIAEKIARKVLNMLVQGRNWWRPDWTMVEDKTLGRYVGDIWIWPNSSVCEWTSAESGTAGNDVRRVQETIRGKEEWVSKYRDTCEVLWLLIVADAKISTYFSPDEDFPGAVFETTFDRVFLFDVFHSRVIKLATNKA